MDTPPHRFDSAAASHHQSPRQGSGETYPQPTRVGEGKLIPTVSPGVDRVAPPVGLLVITSAVGLAIAVALLLIAEHVYDGVQTSNGLAAFDHPVLSWVLTVRSPALDTAVTAFTTLGGSVGMTLLAGAATTALVVRWRSARPLLVMMVGVAGSLTLTTVGKHLIGRVRPPSIDAVPPLEVSPSFPSGHTLNSTVIALLLAYLMWPHLRASWARAAAVIAAIAWAIAMGASRVYLGHHWLTDVIVGWLLGLAWLSCVIVADRCARAYRSRSRATRSLTT